MTKNTNRIEQLLKDMTVEDLAGQLRFVPMGIFVMPSVPDVVSIKNISIVAE